jgi:guanosine-3',5'-bis(diphosphate) 3'-pyrophosphohydrolase
MLRLGDIIDTVLAYNPEADLNLIRRAYVFSAKVHQGQVRLSGEPYLSHPLEVSGILAKLKLDTTTVAVGLLHDTVEDTLTTLAETESLFNEEIRSLVDGVTKISKMAFSNIEEHAAENIRKMILAMAKDIRIILIKLADRLHNMRTLEYVPAEKQLRIAQETLEIYAPLANRMGIGRIKWELEDLSFRYLQPEIYKDIEHNVAQTRKQLLQDVEEMRHIIKSELKKANIQADVLGRPKHYYSIYHKMQRKGVPFEEILDLLGIRIITDSTQNCYGALGIIHSLWTPIPGEFDDYIAMPKPNMYQSLHTAVMGPHGKPLEIQIRTQEMHRIAERGIAAHWRYKEKGKLDDKYDKQFVWLQQLLEWQQDLKDPREFMRSIKTELFQDEVYVFTPKGEVKGLTTGATPIDFAYSIHTDIGHQCVGAKVNGKMVPLKYELKNGDIVEITTLANHTPSRDWLKIVKTPRAINRIRHWLKIEQRQKSIALGKEICEKELKRNHLNLAKLEKLGKLLQVANQLGFLNIEELMAAIGYGKVSVQMVIGRLAPTQELHPADEESKFKQIMQKLVLSTRQGVKIKGLDDLMINFAKCCNPVIGDEIVGFITRGRGVSVHQADCPNVLSLSSDPERKIEVEWGSKLRGTQPVGISIISGDRPGLLAEITGAISKTEANIITAHIHANKDQQATHQFVIEVKDLKHLNKIIKSIEQIKDVVKVERVRAA